MARNAYNMAVTADIDFTPEVHIHVQMALITTNLGPFEKYFPKTFSDWKALVDPCRKGQRAQDFQHHECWWYPWFALRPFFKSRGYTLFELDVTDSNSRPCIPGPPSQDSFGLYGSETRNAKAMPNTEFFHNGIAVAARDESNRDVVIKLLGKRSDSPDISEEYQILCLLNTESAREDQRNATLPVLEFIDYEDWKFAVMPMWCGSAAYPLLTSEECLNLASQLLHALAYLHEKNIAHRDISPDNLVLNYHGHLPDLFFWSQPEGNGKFCVPIPFKPVPEFRSTFPVKYSLIDFGYSVHFPPDTPRSERLINDRRGRPTRAPEVDSDHLYDPFTTDVYQAAQMIFSWFGWRILNEVPKLLDLMHDMTSANPADRISVDSAASRMKILYDELPPREQLARREIDYSYLYPVPIPTHEQLAEAMSKV
ncbi:hypothetical protein NLJ89_g5145 [Agrocybe chaxingu]|uniref:Protein kinase domain-containing protein n=1 Tax=Agrocybe chaxingu TaxID=84603 RepID=A0A9W8JZ42_9AGAR|nr:hypothetical protein NLJ89_g5145 [Agrocybe chaxingu]